MQRLADGARKRAISQAIDAAAPYRSSGSILAFDVDAGCGYADVVDARQRAGRPISTHDAEIAAICKVRGASLATRNTGDFVETGADLIDPWSVPPAVG